MLRAAHGCPPAGNVCVWGGGGVHGCSSLPAWRQHTRLARAPAFGPSPHRLPSLLTVLAELVVVKLRPELRPRHIASLAWSFARLEQRARPQQRCSGTLMAVLSKVSAG